MVERQSVNAIFMDDVDLMRWKCVLDLLCLDHRTIFSRPSQFCFLLFTLNEDLNYTWSLFCFHHFIKISMSCGQTFFYFINVYCTNYLCTYPQIHMERVKRLWTLSNAKILFDMKRNNKKALGRLAVVHSTNETSN